MSHPTKALRAFAGDPKGRPMSRLLNALPTLVWLLAAGFAVGVLIALR